MSSRLFSCLKILFLFLFLHNPGKAQTDSMLNTLAETMDSCFLSLDTTPANPQIPHPSSLKKNVLHEKEKIKVPLRSCVIPSSLEKYPIVKCGTGYEKEKNRHHHYWLLVVSGFSFIIMILLIAHDRKTSFPFKKLS